MSRQNPLFAAFQEVFSAEPNWTAIYAKLNSLEIADDYAGDIFSYRTMGRRRLLQFEFPATAYTLPGTEGNLRVHFQYDIPLVPSAAGKNFITIYMLIKRLHEEGWSSWVLDYLRNERDWTPISTNLWTGYCMSKGLSQPEQKELLATFSHKHGRYVYQVCPLTAVLVSSTTIVNEYINGVLKKASGLYNQPLVFQERHPIRHSLKYLHPITYVTHNTAGERNTAYVYLGWIPVETPALRVRIQADVTNPFVPDIPMTRGLFPRECEGCNHFTDIITSMAGRDLCAVCISTGFPNLDIKSYSTNALLHVKIQLATLKPSPHTVFPSRALLGCELEYNCAERYSLVSRASLLQHLADFVIFKHDGSLQAGGFEIVTAPADITLHKEKFRPVFAEFPSHLKVENGTGMHVHLDRNAITPLMLGRMVEFLNNPDNKGFLETIGERTFNTYCSQTGLNYRSVLDKNGGQRYTTLNISPPKTVEFRFFKAPRTYESFVKNLEFIVALLLYFRTGMTTLHPKEGKKVGHFIDFLKQHNRSKLETRNENHYLMAFLKDRQVL